MADAPAPGCRVQVLLFAVLRERVGAASLALTLPDGATGEDLLDALERDHPALRPYRRVVRLAVNETYVPNHARLRDGDDVALITPVSGG